MHTPEAASLRKQPFQQALARLLTGRTSFVIAHRLSTIRNADQVLMLVDGRFVERGRHDELMAAHGAYYALYMSQFRRVESGEEGMERMGGRSPVSLRPAPVLG